MCFFLFQNQKTNAQVILDPYQYQDQEINVPASDLTFAEYIGVLFPDDDYLLIDTCDMYFQTFGNFTSQSLRKIRLLVNGEEKMMQMSLPMGDHWQFYPNEYLGFPYGNQDTVLFTFVADIPGDIFTVPYVGDHLTTLLTCKYHFASNAFQSFSTNTTTGQTITVTSSNVGIEEFNQNKIPVAVLEGKIFIFEEGVNIFDTIGQQINSGTESEIFVPRGFYYWEQGDKKKGKIIVY
jgi:hypothetical protein